MRVSFATETALPVHRAAFGVVGFALCALALALLVWPSVALQPSIRAIVFVIAISVPASAVSAYLLEGQFRQLRLASLGVLGGAFWFSAAMSIAYLLALPSNGDEPHVYVANDHAATWLWVIWRFGLLLSVVAFVVLDRLVAPVRVGQGSVIATRIGVGIGIPVLVALIGWGIAAWDDYLPLVINNGRFDARFSIVVGYPALLLHFALLLIFAILTRLRTLTQLALSFALLAWLLGDLLTIASEARFTLGWYVGLLDYVASCLAIPVAFLIRLHSLYVQFDQLNESLSSMALLDGLTGLANRRQFDERLAGEWAGATRRQESLALIMADLDFFKRYNDRYGHLAGDECLRRVAQAIRECAKRALDLPARYGGEEFAVILPGTDLAGAMRVAERIRAAIRALDIEHQDGAGGKVSISIGIAALAPVKDQSPALVTSAADRALYDAKSGGRDRVAVASGEVPPAPASPGSVSGFQTRRLA